MKKSKLFLLSIIILFFITSVIKANESEINILIDKFFKYKINELIFKQPPNLVMFENDISQSGTTYIPKLFENFRAIGPLDFINIPTRFIVNFSNYIFEEFVR